MIKHKEFYDEIMNKDVSDDELKSIMPYQFDDKKCQIRTIRLCYADGSLIRELPVYRIILDSRNRDDLKVMAYEEKDRGIMFSDVMLDCGRHKGTDQVSVDYIVENLPVFVQEAIEDEIMDLHWFAMNGVDVNRYYADVEFNKGLDYYYNNVRKEDDKNLEIIKDMIERNAKIKVEIL